MFKLSAALGGLLLVVACGGVAESDIDWTNYSPVDEQDCTRLGNQVLAAKGIRDADLMGYINDVMRDAGCP